MTDTHGRITLQRLGSLAGLAGTGLIVLGMLISGLSYSGAMGEPYRIANHFVSELGERGVSEAAWAFNIGLMLGGACILVFIGGLVARLRGWFRWVLGGVGIVAGVSAGLVGVFPMNNLAMHFRVANGFFYPGLLTMLMFSGYVLLSKRHELPRWVAAPGLTAAGALIVFLFLGATIERLVNGSNFTPGFGADRPDLWVGALSEWVAIGAVLVWVAAVAGILVTRDAGPGVRSSARREARSRSQSA